MSLKNKKKKKNRLLILYQRYEIKLLDGLKKLGHTDKQLKEDRKEFAEHCLYLIKEKRQDKEKTAKQQANQDQLEVIEYLESILEL